jgi:hypothetical protein
MELWHTITAAILGNAVVLAVLGWLAKSIVESVAARDSKRFEGELKAKADAAIEQLKNELQLRLVEHQIKLAKLHERRALAIAEMNSLLAEVMWEAESFLSPMEFAGEPGKREKHATAMTKLTEFFRYFDKNKIYLPAALCASMEKLVRDVRLHVIKFGVYVQLEENEPLLPHTRKEKDDAWLSGWNLLSTQVPAVRTQLEDEFRALLAPGV